METIQNEPLNRCEEVLAHEGVKGMHWYIRRYQPYPSGYDGEGKFVGKRAARKAAKIEKRQARHQAKTNTRIKNAVDTGDKKKLKKYQDEMTPEEYEKKYAETVKNGIDNAVKDRDKSALKKYKEDLNKRDYKHQQDRIDFKEAIDNDKNKKVDRLLSKVDPEDVTEATNLIKSRVALQDQKLSKIRQDSELMAKMDKLASGLGKVSKVTSSVASISKSINDVNATLTAFSKASEESKDEREKKAIERVVKSGDLTKIEQYKERMDYDQLKEAYGKAYVMNTRAVDEAIAKGNLDDIYKMVPWMNASDMSKVITKIKDLEARGAAFSDDISYEDVLAHHGTKGMKWGVRRYQNPDGSLTAAGRKRYLGADGQVTKKGAKRMVKDYKKGLTAATKNAAERSVISDYVVKKSQKELDKSKKKYEDAVNKGSSSIEKKKVEYEARKNLHTEALKRQEKDFNTAKALSNELAEKFGSKTIKSLYDKDGRFKDHKVNNIINNTIRTMGGVAMVGITGHIGVFTRERSLKERANSVYKESYKDFHKFQKIKNEVENIDKPTAKDQRSNFKELTKAAKSSGFDKLNKATEKGDAAAVDKIKTELKNPPKAVETILNSKAVNTAAKQYSDALHKSTIADKQFKDYVKKHGYDDSDTYKRLAENADNANDKSSEAYNNFTKVSSKEITNAIGNNGSKNQREVIQLMIDKELMKRV